ncbi:MAG: carbohydrate binding family 9 domain-containing protein, partial [Ignavibacteriales bacterium]|nr:carbohydrate binding family 9 domain-containing protein [Ignavibacteriales bacterium]
MITRNRRRVQPMGDLAALLSLAVLLSPLLLNAQVRTVEALRVGSAISIDGVLNESEWQRAGITGFIQRQPSEGEPASEKTEAWFAYDDGALYVAVRLYDTSPDSIYRRLVRRDQDFESDYVTIGIDPKLDRNTAYYFSANPSGAIGDGIIYDDNKTDNSYDPVWEVAVSIDELGWTAEFRIPYSQLRFQRQDQYTWGVEVLRRIHRKNEESLLVLHPRNDDIRVSRWVTIYGVRGISPPPRIEILPYIATTGKFLPSPPVASFNQGRTDPFVFGRDYSANIGADAKIGLSGDFTLDATLNPDFAQVEVDPAVVNLTAYETYFAEKRPFFIEGSNILSFGRGGAASFLDFNWGDPDFFYSRRIGRAPQGTVTHEGFRSIPDRTTILGAAKVSGKTADGWSLAALTALTDREHGEADSAGTRFSEEIEPLTLYAVVRGKKQFNESRQSVGVIGTIVERDLSEPRLRRSLSRRAMSLAVDGWTFLDSAAEWVVTGWTGITSVQGSSDYLLELQESPGHWFQKPDADHVSVDSAATTLAGWAGRVWLAKDKGNWRFSGAVGVISPGFESNDLGYHTYTDVINMHLYSAYLWFEPGPVFRTKSISFAALREFNFAGRKIEETYYLNAGGELLSYWGGSLYLGYSAEVFDPRRTRGGPMMKSLPSWFGVLSFYSDTREDFYGFLTLSADRGKSGGWDYAASTTLYWKASTALSLSVGPSFTRNHSVTQYVAAFPDSLATATYDTRYVFAVLDRKTLSAEMRVNWTFSPKASFQLYLQPYLTAGQYSNFRSLARPGTFTFEPYTYPANPDFNFRSLRANAVFRWEYLPGSTLYLVWTNEKSHF